jgi:hypothetical protein
MSGRRAANTRRRPSPEEVKHRQEYLDGSTSPAALRVNSRLRKLDFSNNNNRSLDDPKVTRRTTDDADRFREDDGDDAPAPTRRRRASRAANEDDHSPEVQPQQSEPPVSQPLFNPPVCQSLFDRNRHRTDVWRTDKSEYSTPSSSSEWESPARPPAQSGLRPQLVKESIGLAIRFHSLSIWTVDEDIDVGCYSPVGTSQLSWRRHRIMCQPPRPVVVRW